MSFRLRPCLAAASASTILVAGVCSASPAQAVSWPDSFTSVSVDSTRAGTFTVHWSQTGRNTTSYRLETGLSPFSKTNPAMAYTGRDSHVFSVARTARSFTFSAAELKAAGAPFGSGNVVYFRLSALNQVGTATQTRSYAYLQAGIPTAPTYSGPGIRLGTWNVLTATSAGRSWYTRLPEVASGIAATRPSVITLQELNVGRADGKSGWNAGTPRQTDSLLTQLGTIGLSRYRLVRDTAYNTDPATRVGTQGERILYDSSRLTLGSSCPNTTGSHAYNASCSIRLPVLSEDPSSLTRYAGYAWFTDRSTGKRFYVVSVHLDERHTGSAANQVSFDKLRQAQIVTVMDKINKINVHHIPVVVAGDYNSWQNDRYGDSAHGSLVTAGYTDSYAASQVIRGQYGTFNGNATTVLPGVNNFGTRLDKIMTHGFHGARRWDNRVQVTDSTRPSDHNLVLSDLVY